MQRDRDNHESEWRPILDGGQAVDAQRVAGHGTGGELRRGVEEGSGVIVIRQMQMSQVLRAGQQTPLRVKGLHKDARRGELVNGADVHMLAGLVGAFGRAEVVAGGDLLRLHP